MKSSRILPPKYVVQRTVGVLTVGLLASSVLASCGTGDSAASFPERSIELVNPWSPGGSHDAHARVIADVADEYIDEQIKVSSRNGGGGAVGAGYVANAKADGYTLLLGDQTSVIARPMVQDGLDYTWESFEPIAQINDSPVVLATPADRPWDTMEEFIDAAKSSDDMNYGSVPGFGPDQIGVLLFLQESGIELQDVPLKGGGQVYKNVLAGNIDLAPLFPISVVQDVKEGRVNALAVTSEERLDDLPNVPTLSELGYDVKWEMFRTVFAPKGISEERAEQLADVFENIAKDEKFSEAITGLGEKVEFIRGEELDKVVEADAEKIQELIKSIELS